MSKHFTPPVSIEKFAAYLDNNLPGQEMMEIDSLIDDNVELQEFMNINDDIENLVEEPLSLSEIELDLLPIPEISSGNELEEDESFTNLQTDDINIDELEDLDDDFDDVDDGDDIDDIF